MPVGRPIYRPLSIDAEHVEEMRRMVKLAREVLKQPPPDMFLGRKSAQTAAEESDTATVDQRDE